MLHFLRFVDGDTEVLVALLFTGSYSVFLCLPQISQLRAPMKLVQYLKFASLQSKVWWLFIITPSGSVD